MAIHRTAWRWDSASTLRVYVYSFAAWRRDSACTLLVCLHSFAAVSTRSFCSPRALNSVIPPAIGGLMAQPAMHSFFVRVVDVWLAIDVLRRVRLG